MRHLGLTSPLVFCLVLAGASEVRYSARLKAATRQALEQRLQAPFAEGTPHPPGTSNCAQLLARRGPDANLSSRELQSQRATQAGCMVLRELSRAQPARISYVKDLAWDRNILPFLPPQLAITVSTESERAAQTAALRHQSWHSFDPSATAAASQEPDEIMITGAGFQQQLILWGRGDFNRDGHEDLLVQSNDALTGSYRNTRLFVLTRHTPQGRLSLVRTLL